MYKCVAKKVQNNPRITGGNEAEVKRYLFSLFCQTAGRAIQRINFLDVSHITRTLEQPHLLN